MELFSLLAKLTLDKKEFDTAIDEAESQAKGITLDKPELGLDKDEFDTGIDEANEAEVDDPESPDLDLDKDEFDTGIDEANEAEVDDPEKPNLGIDTDEFDSGIQQAEESGQLFSENLRSIFSDLGGVLAASGIVATVAGVVSSLKEGVELAKNHGDQIDKQSQKMGISAKAYQEWSYALNLSGASINDLNRGLRSWRSAIGDDKKEANLAEAFEALGLNADDAFKQIEKAAAGQGTLDNLLESVVTKLAEYDEGDRGRLMKLLFGNNSTELMALLGQTGEQIKDALSEADELGLVMTDEEVKNAANYMDATTRMEESINALKEALVRDILPFLTDVSNTIADIVSSLNPRSKTPTLVNQLQAIDEALAGNVENLENNEAKAQALLDKLVELGDYNKLDEKGQKTWDEVAKELIELFPQLDGVIDTDSHKITENTDIIRDNIKAWTELEEKRLLDQNLADKRQAIAEQYAKALDKEVEAELRETEASSKQSRAIAQLNEILGRNEELRNAVQGRFGTSNVTAENAADVMNFVNEFTSGALPMGLDYVTDWLNLQSEAEKLRSEAEKMTEEADKASVSYEQYAEALAKKLGISIEKTENAKDEVDEYKKAIDSLPTDVYINYHSNFDDVKAIHAMTHAIGSDYIPYDNYPALLHRGEKVLTATEARRGEKANISSSDLEDRIIAAIRKGMADANVTAVITDRQVARGANNYNGNEMDSRRFRP